MKNISLPESYHHRNRLTIYPGDCLKFFKSLNKNSVQLIVTSPPYNIGKNYEDVIDIDSYLFWQSQVLIECKRVLKPTGSICWQTGNYINKDRSNKKSIQPLDIILFPLFMDLGFKLRNRIIWKFGHGLHSSFRLSGRYEVVCWYTLTDSYIFNLDDIRVKQKYRGKRSYQGNNIGKPSGNPKGKNPSDYWDDIPIEEHELELMYDVWENIPNVKGNHIEKTEHPCQYPVALVRRLIKMLSNKNHLIVDPFVGTGTTIIGGLLEGRRVAGSEIERLYIDICKDRITNLYNGKLKFRQDKPIYKPTGREKVTREPIEWSSKQL